MAVLAGLAAGALLAAAWVALLMRQVRAHAEGSLAAGAAVAAARWALVAAALAGLALAGAPALVGGLAGFTFVRHAAVAVVARAREAP